MVKKNTNKESVKETLADSICTKIRTDIVMGNLQPGEKIKPKDLAERYGVSETPVKLALNRLISEQIIENFPRQGMRIKEIDVDEAADNFDVRMMMDLYYTKEIIEAVNMSSSLQKALTMNIEEHTKLLTEKRDDMTDVELFQKNYLLDYEFHKTYLKCSGNKKLVDLYKHSNPFMYSNFIFSKQSKQKDLAGLEEHKQILQAILDQDEERLCKWIRIHMENAKKAISLIIKTDKIN